MSPEDALTVDVTAERQDSEPWWTVYCSDFVAETSSDWMDESELRDWALEFYEGTEEMESVASLTMRGWKHGIKARDLIS